MKSLGGLLLYFWPPFREILYLKKESASPFSFVKPGFYCIMKISNNVSHAFLICLFHIFPFSQETKCKKRIPVSPFAVVSAHLPTPLPLPYLLSQVLNLKIRVRLSRRCWDWPMRNELLQVIPSNNREPVAEPVVNCNSRTTGSPELTGNDS